MSRYREIGVAEMTPEQKQVHDEIIAGKRGRFGGPFQLLIRSPEACRHLSRLGEFLRWGSTLPPQVSELAICLTARHIRANYEWHAHAPLAIEAGVPAAALEAIRTGGTPHFAAKDQALTYRLVTELIDTKRLSDAGFAEAIRTGGTPRFEAKDQTLTYRLVTELIDTKRLSDASFAEAIAAFGEGGIVELGTIIGYYTAIGNALNVFQVGLPAGQTPYFAET